MAQVITFLVVCILAAKCSHAQVSPAVQKRVIVNVDVGVDDYYALLILLHAEQRGELKIEAIVCSTGNTNVTNVLRNTVRLLELVNRTSIPVYKGIGEGIIKSNIEDDFFGKDGFGDLKFDKQPNLAVVKPDLAAEGLNKLITANPQKISLICLGPLSDIAITLKLFAGIFSNLIKDIWILGGNFRAANQGGATTEFNFLYDPYAAHMVFESILSKPIFIYTYEGFSLNSITYDWRYNVLGSQTPAMALATRAERSLGRVPNSIWNPADAFLAYCFVEPKSCIFDKQIHGVDIEIKDQGKLGWIILDPVNKIKNVQKIDTVDQKAFQNYMLAVGKQS